jgi:hypothetical protein
MQDLVGTVLDMLYLEKERDSEALAHSGSLWKKDRKKRHLGQNTSRSMARSDRDPGYNIH